MQLRLKTPKGNFNKPSKQDVLNWVSFAWDKISEVIIIKSFKRSNALNGTENREFNEKFAEAVGPSSDDLNDELVDISFDDDNDDLEPFDGFSTNDD